MTEIYLGALSGTSMDAVDVIAADFKEHKTVTLAFASYPIDRGLVQDARDTQRNPKTLEAFAQLDCRFGEVFADSIATFMQSSHLSAKEIRAVGLHGQTLLHHPQGKYPFTVQIGNPSIVVAKTGVTTVADFRRADMAYGGQGAPLAPAFHEYAFGESGHAKAIVNIGGIANITLLSDQGNVAVSFDTGPGNCLMDLWTRQHLQKEYDDNGQWAASAQADQALLEKLISDPYFSRPPPKSACTSQFDMEWLTRQLPQKYDPAIIQSTLAALSVKCIATAINEDAQDVEKILICGGGAHNRYLIDSINKYTGIKVATTADEGIDPWHVEALTFAWLARRRLNKKAGTTTTITGARKAGILGAIYQPAD